MIAIFDYIKGFVFVIAFIVLLHEIGKKVQGSSLFSENLIYGFIIYTVFQSVGGVIVQLFRLPWLVYQTYMIVLLLLCILFVIYKRTVWISKENIICHFKKYMLLYAIASIFVVLSILNIQYQWNSNNIDDAYYLNKIAMSPYLDNFVDYNYAVGLPYQEGLVRIANTFEIEAAFFTQILGVSAPFYSKFIMSFINYTLILNAIYWLYSTIKNEDRQTHKNLAIYLLPVLMFGISQEVMNNYHLLYLHDGWQFNTAIWYGSSLVRTFSFIILLIPLIRDGGLTKKNLIFEIGASIALFSKASQIIPVVIVVLLAEIFMCFSRRFKEKKVNVVYAILLLIVLFCVPQNDIISQRANILYDLLFKNGKAIVFIISIGLFIYSWSFKNKMIIVWNKYLLVIAVLLFIPRVNGLFLISSIYDFVMARTMTLYLFTFVISSIFYGGLLVKKIVKKDYLIRTVYVLISIVILYIPIQAIQNNLGVLKTINIILNNKEMVPDSTIMLGNELAIIEMENGEPLKVLSPAWVMMDGVPHSLASMIRYQAPNIISVSALPRFNSVDDSRYITFKQEEQDIFEYYSNGSNMDDKALAQLISTYDINCIVVTSEEVANQIVKKHEFSLEKKMLFKNKEGSYFVLVKR